MVDSILILMTLLLKTCALVRLTCFGCHPGQNAISRTIGSGYYASPVDESCPTSAATWTGRPNRSQAGLDIYRRFVDPETGSLKDNNGKWERAPDKDKYAVELLRAHEGSIELEGLYRDQGDTFPIGQESSNGAVEHLGSGVFVEKDTPVIDNDGEVGDPRTITRRDIRTATRRALDLVDSEMLVVVTGQPGIGKTRGGLTYAHQELLWRGEAVLRVGYKEGTVYAFLPNEDGVYEVWRTNANKWANSEIAALSDAYALIDPPEEESKVGYTHAAICNVIKFASNDAKKHYNKIEKDGELMLVSMPTLDEMLAMTPVLFTFKTAVFDQEFADAQSKEQEVRDRCALIGNVPRQVFKGDQFTLIIEGIRGAVKTVVTEKAVSTVSRYYAGDVDMTKGNEGSSVSSRLYQVEPSQNSRRRSLVMFRPLAKYLIGDELKRAFNGRKRAYDFEFLCGQKLRGATVGGITLPQRTLVQTTSHQDTSDLIRGMKKPGTAVVVAFTNYPVLDFATSVYDWYNAKVSNDENPTLSVTSGAFVTVLLNLGLARKETTGTGKDEIVMQPEHQDAKITLTMIHNSADPKFKLDDKFGNKHRNLDFALVEKLFNKTVAVKFLNIADVSFDLDETEMARLVDKYKAWLGSGSTQHRS